MVCREAFYRPGTISRKRLQVAGSECIVVAVSEVGASNNIEVFVPWKCGRDGRNVHGRMVGECGTRERRKQARSLPADTTVVATILARVLHVYCRDPTHACKAALGIGTLPQSR